MATRTVTHRYRAGTGWAAGYLAALLVGLAVWALTRDTTVAFLVPVAVGPPLGLVFEQGLDTAPFTERERRLTLVVAAVGLALGLLVLGVVFLL